MIRLDPVVVVGLGGIGSHLAEPLARFLAAEGFHATLRLADGDRYQNPDMSRQRLGGDEVGANKAAVQAKRLVRLFPRLRIEAVDAYVHPRNVREIVPEGACVFSCVDNHATRKVLSDALKRMREGVLISGGNELTDGNVQVHLRERGKDLTPPIERFHPEIGLPDDENPAELTCEELAMLPGSDQIIFTNLTAACLMLNAFYSVVRHVRPPCGEVCFDITTNRANPIAR